MSVQKVEAEISTLGKKEAALKAELSDVREALIRLKRHIRPRRGGKARWKRGPTQKVRLAREKIAALLAASDKLPRGSISIIALETGASVRSCRRIAANLKYAISQE